MSAPIITSISPAQAPAGKKVTINGSGFTNTSSVIFGDVGAPNYVIVSDTEITATIPAVNPGALEVKVTVPEQPVSNLFPYTITEPVKSPILNTITLQNNSGLDSSQYTLWVAGYLQEKISDKVSQYLFLNDNGKFTTLSGDQVATFIEVGKGMTIYVPNVVSSGNNRLVFTITNSGTIPAALSPTVGYTAYPFPDVPGVCPPGPYDIFEFGPNAQYDTSAVDSFGMNLSFSVAGDDVPNPNLIYGTNPAVARRQIGEAFAAFVKNDPWGAGYGQLLYTNPVGTGYPILVDGQYSAIVSPKDWLAIYPKAAGLTNYWDNTINAFFAAGNQLNFFLNAATVGNYAGTSDGTQYTLTGPNGTQIVIPASDFAGNQGFIQAVRGQAPDESDDAYKTFNQIEAAIFEAISRGVALDGVVAAGTPIPENYSSDAWINTANWYTDHLNSYNNKPSVYDVYGKFFHYGTFGSNPAQNVFAVNPSGAFGMAYGFSLDENPNVGNGAWPSSNNVPSKTDYYVVADQNVTLVIGAWG